MIIKKAIIKSFGGIKDKELDFDSGLNLVYGENEKGKSTIQNFIRAWLFGFSKARGSKNNIRKKYMPFSGEKMRGELIVSFEGRDYIIKRSFGNTKKEDESVILDYLTGEIIKNINSEAPGEYFLSVNGNTFTKTLYIPQLGVVVSKDKDEQIIEKIIDVFGCGEGEVSVDKAILKLKDKRKGITTTRKSGDLDVLKNRYNYVIEERYESYNIAEGNLSKEEELLNSKEKRKQLREDIDKLKIYKKHNKKMELQKEYSEISSYLKKREVLRKEEEEINESLVRENGILDNKFINELSEDNKRYLALLDFKCEKEEEIKNLKEELNELISGSETYEVFNSMDKDIKEKLIFLNAEQESLKEKILKGNSLKKSIEDEEIRLNQKKKFLGDINNLQNSKEHIKNLFNLYEEKLHLLKDAVTKGPHGDEIESEKESLRKKKNISEGIMGVGILLAILNGIILDGGLGLYLAGTLILILGGFYLYKTIKDLDNIDGKLEEKRYIHNLNKEIAGIEEELNEYVNSIKCNNYENLLMAIKSLDNYLSFKDKTEIILEERRKSLKEFDIEGYREKYLENSKIITSIMNVSDSSSIDEVYAKIDEFNNLKDSNISLELRLKSKEEEVERVKYELSDKEEKIKDKLKFMDLQDIKLVDLEVYLIELKDKINKKAELESRLNGIEETYKVLLKDRNIEEIEEDLKDILTLESDFTYKNEEEIEEEISSKSNELIEIEKRIKDLENSIKSSFLGRRDINAIEEDLQNIVNQINSLELKLKGIDLAIATLEKSGREIKDNFGPTLNKKICDHFKNLTMGKYSEVKLNDNYEMIVRDENEIFSAEHLSNGANDQLYLALRLAFIDIIFKNKEFPVLLDDAFIQYDDKRREISLEYINSKNFTQVIILTCQNIEGKILDSKNISYKKIVI